MMGFWVSFFLINLIVAHDQFTESLQIIQNRNGKVGLRFDFTISIPAFDVTTFPQQASHLKKAVELPHDQLTMKPTLGLKNTRNHRLLAKSISDLIEKFKVKEMHLSFTQGRWAYDRWNDSRFKENQDPPVPPGALLKVWLQDPTQFKGLTNSLAGLFCSSLNFMVDGVTSTPVLPFVPTNPTLVGNATLKYSHLPREVVCTENLTPWAKLLPCKTKAGLASLLNGYKLFDGDYQSMAIHWIPISIDGNVYYQYTQSVTSVLDPLRTIKSKPWSFETLLGSLIVKKCPLALKSDIEFSLMDGIDPKTLLLHPQPSNSKNGKFIYNVDEFESLNMAVGWTDMSVDKRNPGLAPITVHRYLGGSGQERGSIKVEFVNKIETPTTISYTETIPWILKTYLHTLTAHSSPLSTNEFTFKDKKSDIIHNILYSPAIDRERPTVLEVTLTLPPHSTTYLSFDFDFAFVKVTEHHPDAAHGFDIGSAVIRLPNGSNLYTESLLIRLPTPDFSMPYNVITLTCTVLSMYFGSMFNMLTRKYVPIIDKSFKT